MNKIIRIFSIIIGALAFLLLIIALLVSPVAKWYLQKHSKELIGRTVLIDGLRFNLLTGSLRVVNFEIKEQDERATFVRFDTLAMKVNLFDLLSRKLTIRKIHLTDLTLNTWQQGENFNFSDLIGKFNTPADTLGPKDTTAQQWMIAINDIQLRRGAIHYRDLQIGGQWNIEDLSLQIPGVYFSGKSTDIGFNLHFRDGGLLAASLKYDIEKSEYTIHLDLEKFTLAGLLPYIQQNMNVGRLSGLLDAHVDITGNTSHVMNSVLKGTILFTELDMHDHLDALIVSADSLFVDMASIALAESDYRLNAFTGYGLTTRYEIAKDSTTNFTHLMKTTAPDTTVRDTAKTTDQPMKIWIAKLRLQQGAVEIINHTLPETFHYQLRHLSLTADNLDPVKHNKITVRGTLGATGKMMLLWDGNIHDLSNLKLKVDVHNLTLKDFTPYSVAYTAYPISNGLLTFSSHNVVKNNLLKGENNLHILKCEVEKSRKDIKPVMRIPLRLGLYILKD